MKIAGIVLIIISSSYAGLYYSNLYIYKIRSLNSLIKALFLLKSEITFTISTLYEAFFNISSALKDDKQISLVFHELYKSMDMYKDKELDEIWSNIFTLKQHEFFMDAQDLDNIIVFGRTLGHIDKDLQVSSIDQLISYMEHKIVFVNDTGIKNRRMYLSLGIITGLVVVVVLL
jgi:stage III sporulation protein AB